MKSEKFKKSKKKWTELDDWLTLLYALVGSFIVALVIAGTMYK